MEKYNREAIFEELKPTCHLAKEGDFIELTKWHNGEGFDVDVQGQLPQRFQLTYGEFKLLKKLYKKLMKNDT